MTDTTPFSPLQGGCRCGQVRFALTTAPIITHACHCRLCQRASGSAFRLNCMIETQHLKVTEGAPTQVEGTDGHPVFQCPACRSRLWSHHPDLGDAIALVGVGMLDEGERLPPEAHFFIRSKHPWITLNPDVPAFEQLGDPQKPGARERITAALAAAGGARRIGDWARSEGAA